VRWQNLAGLFGSRASLLSDVGLVLEVVTTVLFSVGYFLERRRGRHCVVMVGAVGANVLFVLVYMVTRLVREAVPVPVAQFAGLYRAVVIPHGVFATLALVAAVLQVFLAYRWRRRAGDEVVLGGRKRVHRNVGVLAVVLWYVSFVSGLIIYWILYVV